MLAKHMLRLLTKQVETSKQLLLEICGFIFIFISVSDLIREEKRVHDVSVKSKENIKPGMKHLERK